MHSATGAPPCDGTIQQCNQATALARIPQGFWSKADWRGFFLRISAKFARTKLVESLNGAPLLTNIARRSRGLAQIFFCEYLRNLRETDNREFSVVRGIVLPPVPPQRGLLSLAVCGKSASP